MFFLKWLLFFILSPVAGICYFLQILFDILFGFVVFDFFDSYEHYSNEIHCITNKFLLFWSSLLFSSSDK